MAFRALKTGGAFGASGRFGQILQFCLCGKLLVFVGPLASSFSGPEELTARAGPSQASPMLTSCIGPILFGGSRSSGFKPSILGRGA